MVEDARVEEDGLKTRTRGPKNQLANLSLAMWRVWRVNCLVVLPSVRMKDEGREGDVGLGHVTVWGESGREGEVEVEVDVDVDGRLKGRNVHSQQPTTDKPSCSR